MVVNCQYCWNYTLHHLFFPNHIFVTENKLHDLICNSELPNLRQNVWALDFINGTFLTDGIRISKYRDQQEKLELYYFKEGDVVACRKVNEIKVALNLSYISLQWKLFIDSSKKSHKAVLLHNGNTLPSIAISYAFHKMKETKDNIEQFLKCLSYDRHQSQLYGDLKVVALVIILPYAKYCYFCFKWNNQKKDVTKTRKIGFSGNI